MILIAPPLHFYKNSDRIPQNIKFSSTIKCAVISGNSDLMYFTTKMPQLFSNRVAILATMHQKEIVIAPLLEQLGIKVIVPQNLNTDVFGTFTREIERPGTQIEAARLKAQKALALTGETLAIASEGTFCPHPSLPYISTNREIVIFLDKENELEIIGEEFSLETNHNFQIIQNIEEAYNFAKKVGFPEHGLIVTYDSPKNSGEIFKGIITDEQLEDAVNFALKNSSNGKVHIETDMRAMYNPTRMKNIEKATRNLLKKINTFCPSCGTPGFGITQRIKGLPCASCHTPTLLTRALKYQCKKCGFSQEELFPDGKYADPGQCMYCNP
jgi:Zn finger protein HypA/HybF involved in hydrogenase expression